MAKDDDDFDAPIDDVDDEPTTAGAGDDEDDSESQPKGEDKAVRAARAARKERNEARRQLAELRRELAELKAGTKDADSKKDDAARDRDADERAFTRLRPTIVKAEAKGALVQAGAKPDRVARLVRLLDVDEINVDEKGNVDEDDLQVEVDRVKEEWPELFKSDDSDDDKAPARRRSAPARRDGAPKPGAKGATSTSTAKLAKMLTGSR